MNRSTERSSLNDSKKASMTELSVSGCSTGSIGGHSSTDSRAHREHERRRNIMAQSLHSLTIEDSPRLQNKNPLSRFKKCKDAV